ncbi:MAG: tetratricopeptide repeat-containing sulfotransferase family protein [Halioglobus sp.]
MPNPEILDHHRAAQDCMRKGDLRAAHQHCLAILKLDPTFADAWFLCGVIAAGNGLVEKAIEIQTRAVGLARSHGQDNAEYRAELGKLLLADDQPDRALAEANAALALQPAQPAVLNTLGTLLSHTGENDKALDCYHRAIATVERDNTPRDENWLCDLYFNTGAAEQFAGSFEEAEKTYEKAIALQPTMFRAHSALATLKTWTPLDNHLERLRGLLDNVSSSRDQLHLGHAIAKELEDAGEYDSSLEYLHWAKKGLAGEVNYRATNDQAFFAALQRLFDEAAITRTPAGCASTEPIFIVGMPRTGTTLVEQILGAHSQVFAGGELPHFPARVKTATGSSASMGLDEQTLADSLSLDPAGLGEGYLDSTRLRTGHTPHFTDKLPLNFLYLGLIRRCLPNAKLVCLRRDPMDTCLSNYRQMFASNFNHYYYNLDLEDCGRYYLRFDALMKHWHTVMPGAVLDVQYEELVANPEQQVQALLDHCDLPWEDECLSFHTRKASVATPSAVQVRQGIYTDSVDRWKRYGDAVQPLYELLQSAGLYES